MRLASILDMLKDEELGKSDYHLPIETVVWLATKLKELSDDLVTTTGVKCTGSERHWHYQLESRSYVSHEHAHHFILHTAMHTRRTKISVAKQLIKLERI